MRFSELLQKLLLKHRSLVIGLVVVTSLGVALLIHLGVILDGKKPPRPSPAPRPATQVEINSSLKPRATSAPEPSVVPSPPPEPSRASSRLQSVRLDEFPAERGQGPVVPVIIERRSSAVVITQAPNPKQGAGTPIQEGDAKKKPRETLPAATDDVLPFFAPPDAPEGGIKALVESTAQANIKGALQAYIRTYYPLVALDAASIKHLNPQGKAEYERQKAAFDKELSDVLRDSISPTPDGIAPGYPQELMDMLRKGGN